MRRHPSPLFRSAWHAASTVVIGVLLAATLTACSENGEIVTTAATPSPSGHAEQTFYPSTAPATFEQWKAQWTGDPCSTLTLADLSLLGSAAPWRPEPIPQPDGTYMCQWRSGTYSVTATGREYGPETGAHQVRLDGGRTAMLRTITDSGAPDWWIIIPTFGERGAAVLGVNDRGDDGRRLAIALANSVLPRLPR